MLVGSGANGDAVGVVSAARQEDYFDTATRSITLVDIRRRITGLRARVMSTRARLQARDVVLMDTSPHCQFITQLYRLPLENSSGFVGDCPTTGQRPLLPKAIGKIALPLPWRLLAVSRCGRHLAGGQAAGQPAVHFHLIGAGRERHDAQAGR